MSLQVKKAFTLVQTLLYLALLMVLTVSMISFFSVVQKNLRLQASFCASTIRNAVALDLLRKDLMSASSQTLHFDTFSNRYHNNYHDKREKKRAFEKKQIFVFKKEMLTKKNVPTSMWVAWSIVSNGLHRSEGVYDVKRHRWVYVKKRNIFGCSVVDLSIKLDCDNNSNNIIGVMISYARANAGGKRDVKRFYVRLRNRILT